MKSLCLTTILILCAYISRAQTEKGGLLLGGNIALNSSKIDRAGPSDSDIFTFNIDPRFSYFVIDRLAVGIQIPMNWRKSDTGGVTSESSSYLVGPSLRYYLSLSEKITLFPELTYAYGLTSISNLFFDNNSATLRTTKYDGTLSQLKVGAGINYFLNSNIGIESVVGYSLSSYDYEVDYDSIAPIDNDNVQSDLFLAIGFQIFFRK